MKKLLSLRTFSLVLAIWSLIQIPAQADDYCVQLFTPMPKRTLAPDDIPEWALRNTELKRSQLAYSPLKPLKGRKIESIENDLKTRRIISSESLGDGINNPLLVTLEDGTKAVWKPHTEMIVSNYRAEVLAYEFDRIFGFNLVPPTVERVVGNRKGSLQLFVDNTTPSHDVPKHAFQRQSFFDFLIDNGDRHKGNYLGSPSGDDVISIDHGVSFTGTGFNRKEFYEREYSIFKYLTRPEGEEMIRKLRGADYDSLLPQFQSYLGKEDADELMERILEIIDYYDEKILGK